MQHLALPSPADMQAQWVVKNTFLELVETPKLGARTRSFSESRVALLISDKVADKKFDMIDDMETASSFSTTLSSDGDRFSNSTPRDGGLRASSPSEIAVSESHQEHFQDRSEVLEALHRLTDLVGEKQLKCEDMLNFDVTEQLYPYIPVDDEGNLTSFGSILHVDGTCKPCAFLKKNRCHKKDLCLYCHFEHDDPTPKSENPRKSKSKRVRQARQRRMEQEESFAAQWNVGPR